MPVFLWTDDLLYLLILVIAAFVAFAARSRALREPWLQVLARPMGMVTLVILLAYSTVGVLDSVHYRPWVAGADDHGHYAPQVISLLDKIATPLREHTEHTYSAPFAIRSYVQNVVTRPNGSKAQIYPRLQYGGADLGNSGNGRAADIATRGVLGALGGLAAAALITLIILSLLAWRAQASLIATAGRVARDATPLRWRAGLLTLAAVAAIAGALITEAGAYHVLGTDKVGEDVFFETVKSIRTGLLIGTLTTLVMLPFALALGMMAGYFRGWVDDAIQYLYTTLSSIPGVLLIAAAVLMLQVYMENHPDLYNNTAARADLRLLFLCIILGITSWTSLCRLLRAETLKLREMDYVRAAEGLGAGHVRILVRHVLPNVMHIVLIQVVLGFSGLVLAEAVLSYIGIGVDPSMDSWGNMINASRLEMARDPIVWWPLAAAFLFMLTLVLAANLFADAVRDAFDPRLRQGRGGAETQGEQPPAGGAI